MLHNYNSSDDKYSYTKKQTENFNQNSQLAQLLQNLTKYKNNPPSTIYIPAQQLITTPKNLSPPDSSKKNTKFIMPHAQPFQTYYQNRTLSTYPKYALLCKSPLNTMPNLYHLTKTVEPLIIFPFAFI